MTGGREMVVDRKVLDLAGCEYVKAVGLDPMHVSAFTSAAGGVTQVTQDVLDGNGRAIPDPGDLTGRLTETVTLIRA